MAQKAKLNDSKNIKKKKFQFPKISKLQKKKKKKKKKKLKIKFNSKKTKL